MAHQVGSQGGALGQYGVIANKHSTMKKSFETDNLIEAFRLQSYWLILTV